MSMDRRKFLKLSALAASLGIAGKPVYNVIANESLRKGKKRYVMIINIEKMLAKPKLMDKCIKACNEAHNIPNIPDKKKEIKWIWKEQFNHAFLEQDNEHIPARLKFGSVLLLCNHCDNPPCVSVCPTQATWKREEDGIVMMDWHRCIGCRYCMAACPYGSRSFNFMDPRLHIDDINSNFPTRTKGVVEKCTFCEERIAEGKKPACVEVCCDDEMIFGDLNEPGSKVRKVLSETYSIRRKPELGTQPEIYYIV